MAETVMPVPAFLVLRCVRGLGPVGARRLVTSAGSAPAAIASLPAAEQEAAHRRARQVGAACADRDIEIITWGSPGYPGAIEALEDAPLCLFARGNSARLGTPSVAIVGTRDASAYGGRVTRRLVAGLVEGGVTVVSGLARGIDTIAHRAALEAGGFTVAVLGTGVDVCYPRTNERTYREIAAHGAVVSEVLPGTPARPGAFPRRNRLVAALADVTVVVEAGARSGALITAQCSAALGRPIAAVPGPVDAASSDGSNALLRDGAHVVTGAEDVLAVLDLTARGRTRVSRRSRATPCAEASPAEFDVLAAVARTPARADDLVDATGRPVSEVVAALAALELRGTIEVDPGGYIHAVRPQPAPEGRRA